jgi:hypothetical protein
MFFSQYLRISHRNYYSTTAPFSNIRQREVQEYMDPYLHSARLDGGVRNNNGEIIVLWNVVSCSLLIVTNVSEEPATCIFRTGDGAESRKSNIEFLCFLCFVSETTETDFD